MDQYELRFCLAMNKYSSNEITRIFFSIISRLGNGLFWYILIFALPLLYGQSAVETSITMAVTGIAGVVIYKLLKNNLVRQRPCISHACISQGTAMLDLYSFPSGHTLHAFSFCIIAVSAFPELGLILIPFTMLVAASRVVLGLHYPTDVLVGALLGTLLAAVSI
ncbi:MAG: undecaprenyl-diphosphatase [Pseudomonadota bacterium]|nr:undecaprenyl-diphosphatase [Pseudomonadota bacterium]